MASLLAVSVGNLFVGALLPGLLLSGLYFLYISVSRPSEPGSWPPPLPEDAIELKPTNMARMYRYLATMRRFHCGRGRSCPTRLSKNM